MAATITDNTPGPIVVQSGNTVTPFTAVNINDGVVFSQTAPNISGGGTGTLRVTLTAPPGGQVGGQDLGTLASANINPLVTGTFDRNTETFTEQTWGGLGTPPDVGPTEILHNLHYTAPVLGYRASEPIYAQISFEPNVNSEPGSAAVSDAKPVQINVVSDAPPPAPSLPAADPAPLATLTPATIGEPVFRFYDPSNQDHFFTADANEAAHIRGGTSGLVFEGSAFHGVPGTDANATPVYRFYEPGNNSHFYTDDVAEMKHLVASNPGLLFEGAAFSAHATMQAGDVAVYRFYEPNSDVHFYSSNAGEIATLSSRPDFLQEGVAFFAKA